MRPRHELREIVRLHVQIPSDQTRSGFTLETDVILPPDEIEAFKLLAERHGYVIRFQRAGKVCTPAEAIAQIEAEARS